MIDTNDDTIPEYERPNKSKLKRESQALLDLAKKLVELPESKWQGLALPEQFVKELHQLKDIRQNVAKKRQLKLVAKLLRDVDITLAIQATEDAIKTRVEVSVSFHRVERWRDRLLTEGGGALTDFLGEFQGVDVQALSQLIRNSKHELSKNKSPKSSKLLFKVLREIIG